MPRTWKYVVCPPEELTNTFLMLLPTSLKCHEVSQGWIWHGERRSWVETYSIGKLVTGQENPCGTCTAGKLRGAVALQQGQNSLFESYLYIRQSCFIKLFTLLVTHSSILHRKIPQHLIAFYLFLTWTSKRSEYTVLFTVLLRFTDFQSVIYKFFLAFVSVSPCQCWNMARKCLKKATLSFSSNEISPEMLLCESTHTGKHARKQK